MPRTSKHVGRLLVWAARQDEALQAPASCRMSKASEPSEKLHPRREALAEGEDRPSWICLRLWSCGRRSGEDLRMTSKRSRRLAAVADWRYWSGRDSRLSVSRPQDAEAGTVQSLLESWEVGWPEEFLSWR